MDVILIYLFIVGLFFGSFYNVVALRLSNNESIIYPGSHCVNCNHKLSWYELIPVFSYIGLRGKCKKCKVKISIQYPLIELLTGTLFALSYYIFGFTVNTLISIVLSSLVVITLVSDFKYMIILDEALIISGLFLVILFFIQGGLAKVGHQLLYGLLLFLLVLLIKILGDRAFKQESLGWGDVKLSFIAGLALGIKVGVIYIFAASFLALPYALYFTIRKKEAIVPFGPFLVLSMLILFWNMNHVLLFIKTMLGR